FIEVEIEIVVEVDDERLVLWIAGLDESESGFIYAGSLVSHAAAIVDHQAHADGNILALKGGEFLLNLVFENAKAFDFQAVRELAAIIEHRGMQNHEADIDLDGRALFPSIGILPWWERLRGGNGNLRKARRKRQSHYAEKQNELGKRTETEERTLSGWARSTRSSRRH